MIRIDLDELRAQAAAIGTDDDYRKWIQKQPSCLSGKYSEYPEHLGEGRNPACHVRRAVNSGTAFKPEFSCIPMTHEEHADQTNKGEAYCLGRHTHVYPWAVEKAKDYFDQMLSKYLSMWIMNQ